MRISIDGIIGCGKSTQITRLSTSDKVDVSHTEEVDHWVNEGWIDSFYHDPCRHCFGFQMRVLLSHSKVNDPGQGKIALTERSPYSSCMIFGNMSHHDKLMSDIEWNLNKAYYNQIGWIPDVIIYLECSPELAFKRTQIRNREGEDHMTPLYLKRLACEYEKAILDLEGNVGVHVHRIDASMDEEEVYNKILEVISIYHNNQNQ